MADGEPQVALIDYGMGNLFSVQRACERVGLRAIITASVPEVLAADAVILPGVGAFGDAMQTLTRLGLVSALHEVARCGKPLMGICLGMQLLMTESFEFGCHKGLGLIEGDVVRLAVSVEHGRRLKVPQVGWNRIRRANDVRWHESLLQGVPDGTFMYFVHSFYPRPADPRVILSMTRYGSTEFCSSVRSGNLFGCQYHPERSGPEGLRLYQGLVASLRGLTRETSHA